MLQRLLIERMENRILVGVTAFLGIMILTGWVAINEQGRMEAFRRQHLARSIEKGAELFMANCSTCHATNGVGILGRAPGLNNPSLFGYDYLGDIKLQETLLETTLRDLDNLEAELAAETTTRERAAQIEAELERLREIYGDDIRAGIQTELTALDSERSSILAQLQPAIDNGYNPDEPSRMQYLGWGGTLDSFIQTTLIHGRPTSESYWPEAMVSWSQRAGGPLRDDQIEDITNFILNWERDFTVEDLLAVEQFAIRPGLPGASGEEIVPVGTDVEAILAELEGVTGDPMNGQEIYNNPPLACIGCHAAEAVAPLTQNQWANINNVRLNEPQFAGYTAEQYIVESIVNPGAYLVPGYGNAMPGDFSQRIDIQMLADIIAYIRSYDS